MGSSAEEQFCLRWNDYQDSITSSLHELRRDREFLDVTLWCAESDEQIMAHKVVLSACSAFFKALLRRNSGPNPVIVLWDVSASDLETILAFMYNGEVKVKQEQLNSFLSVAERLRVRGLCQGQQAPTKPRAHNATPSSSSNPATPAASPPPHRQKKDDEPAVKSRRSSFVNSPKRPKLNDGAPSEDEDETVNDEDKDSSSHSMPTIVHPAVTIKEERHEHHHRSQDDNHRDESMMSRDPSEEDYSEYGYGPDGSDGYNDKTIPPPVVGMLLSEQVDSMMDQKGPWNSPGNNSMNRSGNRLSSSDSFGGRRPRSVYSNQQLTQLEAYFRFNEYIDGDRKKQLSIITQIPEQQIKVWFQNRRQKKKRELEEQTAGGVFQDRRPQL